MKNGQNILIALLLFLLLGSLGGIYYINKQYEEAKSEELRTVDVFVSDKNISAGAQIGEKDIKQIKLPKSTVSFKILTKGEIVGRYAKINIYANEPIIEEKIAHRATSANDANLTAQKDRFNIRFNLFQNPNFNLKKGDKIDIIGVYKNNVDPSDNNFAVSYAAKNIKVLDFLRDGMSMERPSVKNEAPADNKDKEGNKKQQSVIFADELLLDMSSAEIAKTLEILNKNHMIWMALSNENRNDEELIKIKESFLKQRPKEIVIKEHKIQRVVSDEKTQKQSGAPTVIYELGNGK